MEDTPANLAFLRRNRILARLPEWQLISLTPHLQAISLQRGTRLFQPGQAAQSVYFLASGLISAELSTAEGETMEVGLIGREGMAGITLLLGHPVMRHSIVVQEAGAAFRVRAEGLREELARGGSLLEGFHRFVSLQLLHVSQTALCNRLHMVERRLARWLLTAADRTEGTILHLTHDFLSQMLGVRRSSITVAATALQNRGLIRYSRGRVEIVARPLLEETACDCYQMLRADYESIYPRV